ncbi:MAG: T9SS type A sorting domain-containing protein [Limnohabitans sp.]|nr:T9SS type A sorting domain-containing protein [Limnohabitans sp.]
MKKQILLVITILLSLAGIAQIPTNNLIKDYKFINGALTSDVMPVLQAGTANLVPTGSARTIITDRNSIANDAISLNGDSFLAGGTNAASVNKFSISFWIKTTTNETVKRYIFDQHNTASNPAGFSVALKDGKIYFNGQFSWNFLPTNGGTNNSGVRQVISPVIADGQWHHVVCTLDSSDTPLIAGSLVQHTLTYTYSLYIDNLIIGSDAETDYASGLQTDTFSVRAITPTKQLEIGKSPDPLLYFEYQGAIDQIRYYEKKLSVAEIDILYNEDKPKIPVYVNSSATGLNNGSSWVNAYTSLETAITNATTSNEIWVAAGIYKPAGTARTSTFLLKNGLTMYGGFNGTETLRGQRNPKNNVTVLSGDVNGNDNSNINPTEVTRQDNLYHIISVRGSASYVLVDGFTIKGGNANGGTLTTGTASAQYYHTRGGAIYLNTYTLNDYIYLKVQNCILEKNSGSDTSVAACYFAGGVNYQNFRLDFDSNIIRDNFSSTNSTLLIAGAGAYNWNGNSEIKNCLFYNNTSSSGASCLYFSASTTGGGTQNSISVDVINSTFSNNTGASGNTIKTDNGSNTRFKNCIIYGNGSANPFNIAGTLGGPGLSNTISEGGQISGINSNPLLNSDFTLQSSSPAIDAGNNTLLLTMPYDLNGNTRIVNSTVDLGCYEYNSTLSTNELATFSDFSIYPNPTNDIINISSSENIKSIEVYSLEGRKIKSVATSSIDISDLSNGMYLVQLQTEDGKLGSKKVLKN